MRVLFLVCSVAVAAASFTTDCVGAVWTVTSTRLAGVSLLSSVAYGNGTFVATGTLSPKSSVVRSRDGVAWQFAATVVPDVANLAFANGKFTALAKDGLWQSTDGDTWVHVTSFTLTPSNPFRFDVMAAGFHTLMISNSNPDGTLLYSPDGIAVRPTAPLPGSADGTLQVSGIAWMDGFFYVAYSTNRDNTSIPHFVASRDGATWSNLVGVLRTLNSGQLAYGPDRIVAIDGAYSITTADGRSFDETPVSAIAYDKVYYAGGRFFSSGDLLATRDGITWSALATFTLPPGAGVFGVAYGNGRYVAVGGQPGADLVAYLDYAGPPTVAVPPSPQTAVDGRRATFGVTVDQPDGSTRYQWKRDGQDLAGATKATLTLTGVTRSDAAGYSVRIDNAQGHTETEPAQLIVVPASQGGRIINLSVLTPLDSATDTLAMGFVLGGEQAVGTKPLLVRAAGPSLAKFAVVAANPDPNLELFADSTSVATNDNWGGSSVLADLFDRAGAFAFVATDSKDAAYAAGAVPLGKNSVWVRGTAGSVGPLIAEVYDYSAASTLSVTTPRLINVSVLKPIATGATLTAGFYIDGSTPVKVLVRAIGPGLKPFGVSTPAANPRLSLFQSGATQPLRTNEDWGGGADLSAAFDAIGAFGLPADSSDAAMLTTLGPGGYSAQANVTTGGTVLVEVYEVP